MAPMSTVVEPHCDRGRRGFGEGNFKADKWPAPGHHQFYRSEYVRGHSRITSVTKRSRSCC